MGGAFIHPGIQHRGHERMQEHVRVRPSDGTVRGVRVSGIHFGALECDDPPGDLAVNAAGELARGTVTVQIPVIIHGAGPGPARLVIDFRLGEGVYEPVVAATLTVDGAEYGVEREEILEAVLDDLAPRSRRGGGNAA